MPTMCMACENGVINKETDCCSQCLATAELAQAVAYNRKLRQDSPLQHATLHPCAACGLNTNTSPCPRCGVAVGSGPSPVRESDRVSYREVPNAFIQHLDALHSDLSCTDGKTAWHGPNPLAGMPTERAGREKLLLVLLLGAAIGLVLGYALCRVS